MKPTTSPTLIVKKYLLELQKWIRSKISETSEVALLYFRILPTITASMENIQIYSYQGFWSGSKSFLHPSLLKQFDLVEYSNFFQEYSLSGSGEYAKTTLDFECDDCVANYLMSEEYSCRAHEKRAPTKHALQTYEAFHIIKNNS